MTVEKKDRIADLEAENKALREVAIDVLAHLVAAHSLLSNSPKTGAPSNKMFDRMLMDYSASIDRARAYLRGH